MKISLSDFSIPGVSLELEERVLVMRYGESIFDIFFDLEARESYIALLKAVDNDAGIHIVLSLNEHGCLSDEPYDRYINRLKKLKAAQMQSSWSVGDDIGRARQHNFHHYTIEQRLKSKKVMIDGLQGTVVTPFFGESLSSDIRLVSEDFKISLAHKKYGIHPSGGLAYFLPRYVGQGKSSEILLGTNIINAKKALDLGLVTHILSNENFESRVIQKAKELSDLNPATVTLTKKLLNYDTQSLEDYFTLERDLF